MQADCWEEGADFVVCYFLSFQKVPVDIYIIKGGILKMSEFLFTLGVFNLNYLSIISGKLWSKIKSKDSFSKLSLLLIFDHVFLRGQPM